MSIDPKAVQNAEIKVLKPKAAGLKANPADVVNLKKLKQQKAKEDLDAVSKGVEEDAEEGRGIHVVDSLGYDHDDNEHFEVNVNGKIITILEEPDRTLHAVGGRAVKDLFDHNYEEIKNVVISYHQSKHDKSEDNAEQYPTNPYVETTQIANFLKAVSQKKYAEADKYLQGTVESKLKAAISRAVQNTK